MKPETLRESLWDGMGAARETDYSFLHEEIESGERDAREQLIQMFVRCREAVHSSDPIAESFEDFAAKNKEVVEAWLDDYYLYESFYSVSEMVERTLLLAKFATTSTPSEQTNRYISEASRCYIHGFMIAAVALARAALEQSLKEHLGKDAYDDRNRTLGRVINEAEKEKILSAKLADEARKLNERCNQVMHARPVKDDDAATSIFDGIRILIREIYSGNGSGFGSGLPPT